MIDWPQEWEPESGWGKPRSNTLTTESRQWNTLRIILSSRYGVSRDQRIATLGGPSANTRVRSLGAIQAQIQEHFGHHQSTPVAYSNAHWKNVDSWLQRSHNLTLAQLCAQMGLPVRRARGRTLESVENAIRDFVRDNGEGPTTLTSKKWTNINAWLRRRQGTSLNRLCNQMAVSGVYASRA